MGAAKTHSVVDITAIVRFSTLLLVATFLRIQDGVAAEATTDIGKTYIIHMCRNASHVDALAKSTHYTSLLNEAKKDIVRQIHDIEEILHHVYDRVFDGFSARLTDAQAAYIRKLPGVLGLFPDQVYQVQTTRSPDFLGLTQSKSRLWLESNRGEDVIIGVIDSGIWPERLSFSGVDVAPVPVRWKGDCVAGTLFDPAIHCSNKLIGAKYFVEGNVAEFGPVNETVEYVSPRDFMGHGTHCAGTAAGRTVYSASSNAGLAHGTAYGMAPKARVAVYKVCWSNRGCMQSDILKAFDAALTDGVDIISFSIAQTYRPNAPILEFSDDLMAIAAYNAVKQGVFVSTAAGNSGPGYWTVANVAPWFMTVAAATQDRENQGNVQLGDGQVILGRSTFDGTGMGGNSALPLMYAGDAPLYVDAVWNASVCQGGALDPAKVTGKIILCDYNPLYSNAPGVFDAGAVGVIFANGKLRGEGLSMGSVRPKQIPYTQVGNRGRTAIMAYIRANPSTATASLLPTRTVLGVVPAPEIAVFSSRGPIRYPVQWLKPDITAPGVDILAAGINDMEFTFKSGTSMACPHITGLAACVKAIHPTWSPAMIKSALMTTATSQDNSAFREITIEENGVAAIPIHYGAGFVQPERAINPGLVYDMAPADYLTFLCALNYPIELLQRVDALAPPCPSTKPRVEDTNLPSFYAVFSTLSVQATPAVSFSRTLTNVEATGATYTATVVNPSAEYTFAVVPSTLTFAATGDKQSFTLTVTSNVGSPPLRTVQSTVLLWSDGVHIVQTPIVMQFLS